MTIAEAIAQVDALKPNKQTSAQKIKWLSNCDSTIFDQIILTHEGDEDTPTEFAGYTSETDDSTALLVPAPYDELYLYYLYTQIDFANMELQKYNNDMAMFNTAYQAYAAYYNRKHMPTSTVTHFTL